MKVLLVHGRYWNSWEALGLGYLGAYLTRHVPGLELDFAQGCFEAEEDILARAARADWVLFSCTSPTYAWAARLARRLPPPTRTVIGGYHASAVPETVGPEFDHVVVGEGEWAAAELLDGREHGRIVVGRPLPFEALAWPDRRLIRNERNIAVAQRDTGLRITSFQAHRGCPHRCTFCLDGAGKVLSAGRPVWCRARPVDDLLAEIAAVAAEYALDFFKFCDATWNLSVRWVREFCAVKAGRGPALPWFANIHAAVTSPVMFAEMAAAGCRQIGLGIESGSDRILAEIGKGIRRRDIVQAVEWASAAGIKVRGYCLLGVPSETENDLRATADFVAELLDRGLTEVGFALLCPYPGTLYYRRRPELHGRDWENVDEYDNDFWATDTVSNARLRAWQTELTARFRGQLTARQLATPEKETRPCPNHGLDHPPRPNT